MWVKVFLATPHPYKCAMWCCLPGVYSRGVPLSRLSMRGLRGASIELLSFDGPFFSSATSFNGPLPSSFVASPVESLAVDSSLLWKDADARGRNTSGGCESDASSPSMDDSTEKELRTRGFRLPLAKPPGGGLRVGTTLLSAGEVAESVCESCEGDEASAAAARRCAFLRSRLKTARLLSAVARVAASSASAAARVAA